MQNDELEKNSAFIFSHVIVNKIFLGLAINSKALKLFSND